MFFFCLCISSWFFLILWRGHFSLNQTMPSQFSVCIMWIGTCGDVLKSTEIFQSLTPLSSSILEVFFYLTVHSPSLWNWIMGCLTVTGSCFAVSQSVFNNSIIISNILLCRHVYIGSGCGHVDSTWHKVLDHVYTKNTGLIEYIPKILGWSHLVEDHM